MIQYNEVNQERKQVYNILVRVIVRDSSTRSGCGCRKTYDAGKEGLKT